jgi:carnitine O-acetyltransferase
VHASDLAVKIIITAHHSASQRITSHYSHKMMQLMNSSTRRQRWLTTAASQASSTFATSSPPGSPRVADDKEDHLWKRLGDRQVWDSNGDYQRDSWLEKKHVPLYQNQDKLPHLPVPSLEDTIALFLPTAMPLARNEQERQSLHEACQSFVSQAQCLQDRLLRRRDDCSQMWSSWLQLWWNQLGYLQERGSNALHVSYFFQLADDPDVDPNDPTGALQRSAALLHSTVSYAQAMLQGSRPGETTGKDKTPLCSSQFKYLFAASRLPRPSQDEYRLYRVTSPEHYYAVVAYRQQYYCLPLVSPTDGRVYSRMTLYQALQSLVAHAPSYDPRPQLGWMTATNRTAWSQMHGLFQQESALQSDLELLQGALVMLCLDLDAPKPTETEHALRLWHGNYMFSANRWYDKSLQLIVNSQGQLGYVGEHSMADGMPAVGYCQHLISRGSVKQVDDDMEESTDTAIPVIKPLFTRNTWNTVPASLLQALDNGISAARLDVCHRIDQHELCVQHYRAYGSQEIKAAGCSPDAWVQMAMQLASYRVFGELVGTYESTHTRKFLHGRTETTRTVSPHALAFVQAMSDPSCSAEDCRKLLHMSTDSHVQYTRKALNGRGVDRHFFGLSMLMKPGEPVPDLFHHPVYQRSKRWRLSTSTLPDTAPGFGNVEDDGVGIGYEIRRSDIVFSVTGRRAYGYTHPIQEGIGQALDEMLMLFVPESMTMVSKL